MEYKRILWPTDFSENANAALPHVMSLSEKYAATVLALHVAEIPEHFALHKDFTAGKGAEDIYARVGKEIQDKLEAFCKEHLAECAEIETRVSMGAPEDVILKAVEEGGVDLVVMATHGYGGFKRWIYGGVAQRVAFNSKVPVLLVRAEKD
jgi:nucleotide-binding universal stress UspA family protein